MKSLVLIAALSLLATLSLQETFHAKIVGPPHQFRSYPTSALESKSLAPRAPPANISGPPHLRHLAGHCFKTRDRSYTYSVCPFQNVTQEEDRSVWNSYHGVLGVWREWIVEGDQFVGMLFEMGEKCSDGDRSVKIMLNCSTMTILHNITEPHTCKYTMWLQTPLACFRGAMQVYHLLTPSQIEQWDAILQEYHAEEITKKGMRKRQRPILLEAGLAYNFTIDELYRKQEEQQATSTPAWSQVTSSPQELEDCTKKKNELESEVESLNKELSILKKVLDEHPLLKATLERLVAEAHETPPNGTAHTKTNSTYRPSAELSKNSEPQVTQFDGGFATEQQEAAHGGRHGNHIDLSDQGIDRETAGSDDAFKHTTSKIHPGISHNGSYPQESRVTNKSNFKVSKKHSKRKEAHSRPPQQTVVD